MNVILLEPNELGDGGTVVLRGRRARHILAVLHGRPGLTVRVGVIDGNRGTAEIVASARDSVSLRCNLQMPPMPPSGISVLLALPRPKVMGRLWAPLASLGVDRIMITNAAKVERCYFDTHWLEEQHYGRLLREGLEQSGDTKMPPVLVRKRLKPFLEDELDELVPTGVRLLAHPMSGEPAGAAGARPRADVLLAIGPEGGWTHYEVKMFAAHGFAPVSLGPRTLRTDVACISLLAVVAANRR